MQSYYYLALDIFSFLVPFLFSFERKRMHFIQHWKSYFLAIISVGGFFILWDIYFTYQNVWGFNDDYLIGFRLIGMPIEEYLFFLLIPYSSVFIHYALEYFLPKFILSKKLTQIITIVLFIVASLVAIIYSDRIYTLCSFGLFGLLMLFQLKYQWKYLQRFYVSFIIIYIPFFFVNNALTGAYSEKPVVYYDDLENLGIRVGTMPLEDTFYCFTLLYSIVVLFEFLKARNKKVSL